MAFYQKKACLEALDILKYCWTGKYPNNRAPTIDSVMFNGNSNIHNLIVSPGIRYPVKVNASDNNNDNFTNTNGNYIMKVMI